MIDPKAFHTLSYGLYVISSVDDEGRQVGCVANTFTQIASTPPLVSVSLNKDNATTRAIEHSKRYNVSVLSIEATMELIGCFGFKSSYDIDKFAEFDHVECSRCIPYLGKYCVARFCVDVRETLDAATHTLFIGEVVESEVLTNDEPMTYSYYHEVLRGKTPPKAASFNPDSEDVVASGQSSKKPEAVDGACDEALSGEAPRYGWRCMLCGYIVEVDELDEDFVCPICGAGRELFERIEL